MLSASLQKLTPTVFIEILEFSLAINIVTLRSTFLLIALGVTLGLYLAILIVSNPGIFGHRP